MLDMTKVLLELMSLSMSKIFFILFIIASVGLGQTVKLTISSNSPDAGIFINGKLVGQTSVILQVEQHKKYAISIKEDILQYNSQIINDTIHVSDTNINKHYTFKKSKYLTTYPSNVTVQRNNQIIGKTPLFLNDISGNILLFKTGYSSQSISYAQINNIPIRLEPVKIQKEVKFTDTIWFKVFLGSAVVLGGTAAYYKIRADDNYDSYLQTGNQAFKDKTDDYDMISGIAFGLLQINFGYLIYGFVTE